MSYALELVELRRRGRLVILYGLSRYVLGSSSLSSTDYLPTPYSSFPYALQDSRRAPVLQGKEWGKSCKTDNSVRLSKCRKVDRIAEHQAVIFMEIVCATEDADLCDRTTRIAYFEERHPVFVASPIRIQMKVGLERSE